MTENLQTIKLPRKTWQFDHGQILGKPGGFGTVYAGLPLQDNFAVKSLRLDRGVLIFREIDVVSKLVGRVFANVLPVLDAGQDAETDGYFVVMPKADRSLQNDIDAGKHWNSVEAAEVLTSIASGLMEIPEFVHRDLKPANILWHDGAWKIADFGIARIVENSTSEHTLRGIRTSKYAAPEQWNYGATSALTDVYAIGCIGFSLLTGNPPFLGTPEELKRQHLTVTPPSLPSEVNALLQNSILHMLRKPRDSRPGLRRVLDVLESVRNGEEGLPNQNIREKLAKVAGRIEEERAKDEAEQAKKEEDRQEREELVELGLDTLLSLVKILFQNIEQICPDTRISVEPTHILLFGASICVADRAVLEIRQFPDFPDGNAFPKSKWDVIAGAEIRIRWIDRRIRPVQACLWYMRRSGQSEYRWHEVSYSTSGLHGPIVKYVKVDNVEAADEVASNRHGVLVVDDNRGAIDDEHSDQFINRWMERLTDGLTGNSPQWD